MFPQLIAGPIVTYSSIHRQLNHRHHSFSRIEAGAREFTIGLGLIMGFQFPDNFKNPYLALSMTDFWRRWHITLGSWFREYVYIPLGGNRKHPVRNLLLVWMLTGFWHGANWNFVLWGLLIFVLIAIEKKGLGDFLKYGKMYLIPLIAGCICCTGIPRIIYEKKKFHLPATIVLVAVFWGSGYCMYIGLNDPFLYFNF